MPRFSANISMMFTEYPVLDRVRATADAGFAAIEVQFPYDHPPDAWARAKADAGMEVAVFNLPVGDMLDGGPGLAAMPGREPAFAGAIETALPYAEALAPRCVNILAGWPPAELPRERCLETLASNLRSAAEAFEKIGVIVVTEAVNARDRPGYFLKTSAQAIEAIDRAGHPNLGIEHDLYHMQIMEGDLVPTLKRLRDRIGHIQFADTPGRHEPGTGEINFDHVFGAIDAMGYAGFVGAEYNPTTERTVDSLGWMKRWIA